MRVVARVVKDDHTPDGGGVDLGRSRQPLGVEHAILGLLGAQPAHAYDVFRRLTAADALGPVWPLKQSQFYALVARLAADGLLVVTATPRPGRPPLKLLGITPAGEAAFGAWLRAPCDPADDPREALLARLFFARRLGPGAVQHLLAGQRQQTRARLAALRRSLSDAPAPHSYPWLVQQWHARQAEAALDWLDTFGPPPERQGITYRVAVVAGSPARALAEQLVAFACGPAGQATLARAGLWPAAEGPPPPEPAAPLAGRLVVHAASSLTAAFEALGAAFQARHPAVELSFVFGGSQALADALAAGAHADVFAPAHADALATAASAGRLVAGTARALAHNQLAIVTPALRPAPLHALSDLARPGLRVALGSGATAIGRYALEALGAAERQGALGAAGAAGVLHNVVHYAESVTAVLATVARGEVDAGIVFTSDYHRAAGGVLVAAVPTLA